MPGFSTYFQNLGLNYLRGTAPPTAPAAVYVALFSADPTDAGSLTNEVTTTVRTAGRVAGTFGAPTTTSTTSTIANSAIVDFGQAAGAANVTFFGLFDGATGGNMLASGAVTGGNIAQGNAVSYAVGALTISSS